jgi:hypothetical protein
MINEQNGKILNCDGVSIRNDTPNRKSSISVKTDY